MEMGEMKRSVGIRGKNVPDVLAKNENLL